MSHQLERLLRASLRAEPPAALEQLVAERALVLARQVDLATRARSRRAARARALALRAARGCVRLYRLGLRLLEQRPATRPADTI